MAANVILHMVTPVLVPVYWLFFQRKGGLEWRHALLWAIFPLAYLIYGQVLGAMTGKYAYPFLDTAQIGWERTVAHAFLIAVAFLSASFALVWLDHRLADRT